MTEMDAVVEAAQIWLEVRQGGACSGMVYHHACMALAEAVQRLNGTLERQPMAPPTAEEIERGREQINKLIELYPATQLQPDGTYEPVPAGPPPPRCPHCLQPAEPGHEERCQP